MTEMQKPGYMEEVALPTPAPLPGAGGRLEVTHQAFAGLVYMGTLSTMPL